ncbi:MAG: hypothetical protein QOI63_12 [Thermoplasmata archaeon]|jgi:hypothetical protein|nr:hypothetical protein [Thermoplasmata archaeon]
MRALAALLAGLLLAGAATAAVVQKQAVTATPSAKVPINALAAGAVGTTTLGTSLASASTTKSGLIVTPQEVLKVKKGASDWDVKMQYVSSSGFGSLDSATVRISGATVQNQVVVALGAVTQLSGTAVALLASGSDQSIQVSGTKVSGGSSVLTMQVQLVPHGGTQPVLAYAYTLTLT